MQARWRLIVSLLLLHYVAFTGNVWKAVPEPTRTKGDFTWTYLDLPFQSNPKLKKARAWSNSRALSDSEDDSHQPATILLHLAGGSLSGNRKNRV